jgi:hypothetical protein
VHTFSKSKKTPIISSKITEQYCGSSNRFTSLINLTDYQPDEVLLLGNHEWSSSFSAMNKTTTKPGVGDKIPTIVNGRVVNGEIKNPLWSVKHPTHVSSKRVNPLTLELNPSTQCYLMTFFTRDFASRTMHIVNICTKNQQIHQLFIHFINYVW